MATVLTYRATLTAPLVITAPGGDPNTSRTRRHLPGNGIRGAVAAAYLRQAASPAAADPPTDPEFRRLFLRGGVRWLDALPEADYGRRLLPTPASMMAARGNDDIVFDLAAQEYRDAYVDGRGRPRRVETLSDDLAYAFVDGGADQEEGGLLAFAPDYHVTFHHQRDRRVGRPIDGGIYTYESIQPGERFMGHVLLDDDHSDLSDTVATLLAARPIQTGRSRSTGYGGAIRLEILSVFNGAGWVEMPGPVPGEQVVDQLVVTLLSDYAEAIDSGQATHASFLTALGASGVVVRRATCRWFGATALRGGYPSVWRMHLPESQVLTAGTVLVAELESPVPGAALAAIEWHGLGARLAEGFGRVAFNRHGGRCLHRALHAAALPAAAAIEGADAFEEGQDTLRRIREGLLKAEMDRQLRTRAREHVPSSPRVPTSVLGRLRSVVRGARTAGEIVDWLDDVSEKKAGRALARVQTGGVSLPDFVRDFLNAGPGTVPKVWIRLGAVAAAERGPRLAADGLALRLLEDPLLTFWYQRKYLDALLSMTIEAAKEA